jgi:hypothetical protein
LLTGSFPRAVRVHSLPVTSDNAGSLPTNAGDLTITAASSLHFSAATY